MNDVKQILLVEDNAKDIELTLAALAKARLANGVTVARDGVEALDYLFARREEGGEGESSVPAVVLLDIKLPRLNGLEVLERIKLDPATRQIPVVMFTSSREEPDLARAYALGVNAFVVKPLNYQEFFQAIRDIGVFWGTLNELPSGQQEVLRPPR